LADRLRGGVVWIAFLAGGGAHADRRHAEEFIASESDRKAKDQLERA
jgi:hypothetical protein